MIVMSKDDFLLLNIISKDNGLKHTQGIYVDTTDKCFIITNMITLIKRPYKEIGEGITTNFFIPECDCKNMKKVLKNNYGEIMMENDIYYFLSGGKKIEMNIKDIDTYPDYASLISSTDNDKKILTLSISHSYMMNILKAIPAGTPELNINIPADKSPLVMEYDDNIALMLPISVNILEPSKQDKDVEND